ncbi:MAG: IS200/IS605 family element transposase accessory protein TnpB [Chloroflexi bacterium]|nr:MAG: IS200/IS605 family element transposase accessory protein TnpB [Chloroflexota bacterium]
MAKRRTLICLRFSSIPRSNAFIAPSPTSFVVSKKVARLAFPASKVPTPGIPYNSVTPPTAWTMDGLRLLCNVGGRLRVIVHRPLEGTLKFARIVLRPSGWYLQCVCETPPHPLLKKENAVGLDMGIRYLVADSHGHLIDNPKHARKTAKRLAHAQRTLARGKKGSHRRKKAKKKVARIHEHIANQRKDTLHKASRYYVDGYQAIVIEDLHVSNMVRNHCLAFAIADASWGMFRQYLEAKAESAGRQVIAVRPHYTSQKCSSCGEYVEKSLSVRTHVCPFCGYIADRDENAARNILQRGLQVLARTGPSSSRREGPEPSGESPSALKREAAGL